MEDLKGKKFVVIKILIDTNKDEFGFDTAYRGFQKPIPLLDQMMLSGIIDLVKKQIMSAEEKEVKLPK